MTLLKRYAKGLSLSVLAATMFSFGAPAVFAQGQNPPAVAQPASATQNVLGAVKLPPLPVLAQKLVGVSQKANLSVEEQMILQFMLMQYGFPSFPGVSASEGVTVFVLAGESGVENGDMGFVGLARISADSPLRGVLTQNGLQISDREGWVLIAPDEDAFELVKDFGTLAAIAADKAHFDIEARVYVSGGIVSILKEMLEAKASEAQAGAGQEQMEKARAWLAFAVKLAEAYDWAGVGLSVNEEQLALGSVIAPKAGTPDAQWINTAMPATQVEAGKFLPAKAAAAYVARFDVPATLEYLKALTPVVQQIPNEKVAQLVQEALEQYGAYLASSSGTLATVTTDMNFKNQQTLGQTLEPGKHTLAQVDAFYGYLFNKLMPDIFALIGEAAGEDIDFDLFKMEQKSAVATLGNDSVSVLIYTTPDPEDASKQITQETYYTVINGAVLTASTLDSLKELAATYSAGKGVDDNLMTTHPLPANSWLRGSLDINLLVKAVAGSLGNDADAEAVAIFAKLEALNLEPIRLDAQAENGRGIYEMSIPMDTVAKLVGFIRALEAEDAADSGEVQVNEVLVVPAD